MKKLLSPCAALLFLAACGGAGNDRNDQKLDVETSYPPAGPMEQQNVSDTSVNGGQDSSTTVGYDTSARRQN